MSRIIELAAQIQQCTTDINTYLRENNLPQPSFDEDAPTEHVLNGEEAMLKARDDVLGATLELHQLLLGPAVCLRPNFNGVSLQVIYKYDIPAKVPLQGEISFSELADKTGLALHNIRRILRFAMVYHRIFKEPREGYVAHTAASHRIRENPNTRDGLGYMFDEIWQSYAHTVPALERWQTEMPNETGWNHYHNSDKRFYEYHQSHPAMAKRFAGAMASFVNAHGNAPSPLAEHYPWDSIGNGTVVDVGGSKGHISVLVAQQYPNLNFIVQGLPEALTGAAEAVLSDVADRIQFREHDFFTPQTVQADVYLFRNIFHNWPDAFALQIIQQLVPALRKGSRIVMIIFFPGRGHCP